MDTAHRTTSCQVHAHPAANPSRIFEVRRMARDAGCQFVPSSKRAAIGNTAGTGPFGGAA